jgi:GMP synthase-like glutamine amidotransferase
MHLAILMSNTDESDFAQAHPKDGEKWPALLAPLCPDCRFSVFSVKDGEFPDNITAFDGALITGSPASVHDVDPWLPKLFDLIRTAIDAKVPLFGACFGHQAIAVALGGKVANNPGGWVFGVTETAPKKALPWIEGACSVKLHAAHIEQVVIAPKGAITVHGNAECPIGGYVIGDKVFTTQYHPEITADFMSALIDELEPQKPAEVISAARASMHQKTDNALFAMWIIAFFRQAQGRGDTP